MYVTLTPLNRATSNSILSSAQDLRHRRDCDGANHNKQHNVRSRILPSLSADDESHGREDHSSHSYLRHFFYCEFPWINSFESGIRYPKRPAVPWLGPAVK